MKRRVANKGLTGGTSGINHFPEFDSRMRQIAPEGARMSNVSEYSKCLVLYGRTHFLSHADCTYYRIDSPEDETRIRAQHERQVEETLRELRRMFDRFD